MSTGLVTAISSSSTPLWLLGFQCVGSAAAALCSAIVLSQKLHQAADRAESGEVGPCRTGPTPGCSELTGNAVSSNNSPRLHELLLPSV